MRRSFTGFPSLIERFFFVWWYSSSFNLLQTQILLSFISKSNYLGRLECQIGLTSARVFAVCGWGLSTVIKSSVSCFSHERTVNAFLDVLDAWANSKGRNIKVSHARAHTHTLSVHCIPLRIKWETKINEVKCHSRGQKGCWRKPKVWAESWGFKLKGCNFTWYNPSAACTWCKSHRSFQHKYSTVALNHVHNTHRLAILFKRGRVPFLSVLSLAGGCHGNRAWLETTGEKERNPVFCPPLQHSFVSVSQNTSFQQRDAFPTNYRFFVWVDEPVTTPYVLELYINCKNPLKASVLTTLFL